MDFIESLLAAHPLFQELEPKHLHMLAKGAIEDRFEAQEYLFSEGDKANKWYVIRKGNVALETGTPPDGPITVETLEAGNVLGWSWLLPPYRWAYSARVIAPTQVIVLDGTSLREQCEEDHDFGYELAKRVAQGVVQRLEALRQRLLYSHPKGL
ncbi:MAG TPA: cyclic nucleotide-binding domain-containing protein [Ktedonobacteraceae bacterium]|nr:cyclic nucleotide-binding domain-containing protein [Ktedonobacteraceae bacterium]